MALLLVNMHGKRDASLSNQLRQTKSMSPDYAIAWWEDYDQWLRLWLLGGPSNALRSGGAVCGKFEHRQKYRELLRCVFSLASQLLTEDAIGYVRTHKRETTYTSTAGVLKQIFHDKRFRSEIKPFHRPTQTRLFGNHDQKEGEVDLIRSPRR